jgi:hypothetical protein
MPALPFLRKLALFLVHLDGARGIGVRLRLRDAFDPVTTAVRARDPFHAELACQFALRRGGGDSLRGAEDRAHSLLGGDVADQRAWRAWQDSNLRPAA